jgi:hypothetical protein
MNKQINLITIAACIVSLALAPMVAAEDVEVWETLQWFGFVVTNAALGAVLYRSVCRVLSDSDE